MKSRALHNHSLLATHTHTHTLSSSLTCGRPIRSAKPTSFHWQSAPSAAFYQLKSPARSSGQGCSTGLAVRFDVSARINNKQQHSCCCASLGNLNREPHHTRANGLNCPIRSPSQLHTCPKSACVVPSVKVVSNGNCSCEFVSPKQSPRRYLGLSNGL